MPNTNTARTVSVPASRYEDEDDCLSAAAADYIAAHPSLAGWDLSPRWVDEQRDEIEMTVPAWAVETAGQE